MNLSIDILNRSPTVQFTGSWESTNETAFPACHSEQQQQQQHAMVSPRMLWAREWPDAAGNWNQGLWYAYHYTTEGFGSKQNVTLEVIQEYIATFNSTEQIKV